MNNKNNEKTIQNYRFAIQVLFVVICIWIGVEFYFFVRWLEAGGAASFYARPPGVEGFLPISSLMSVYYFFLSGEIHGAHPAGFFIFLGILSVSLVFGKSFCSWICPVGLLSEAVADFSEKIQKKLFKRILKMPRFLDIPLRSLKYLILFFFVYSIFFVMTEQALKMFLDSPYNLIADIKMWYFFAEISPFSLNVIFALLLLSMLFRNFWCRYLCPYGALLGVASLISPNKIHRDEEKCIDCGLCNKACPSNIKIDEAKTVISDECSTCLSCVDVCPVADTLQLKTVGIKKTINKKYIAFVILGIYFLFIGFGIITGNWKSDINEKQILHLYKSLNAHGHPTNSEEIKKLNKTAAKKSISNN